MTGAQRRTFCFVRSWRPGARGSPVCWGAERKTPIFWLCSGSVVPEMLRDAPSVVPGPAAGYLVLTAMLGA